MNDLKSFWEEDINQQDSWQRIRFNIGMFFWERGGKRFVENITDYMSGSSCDTSYPNFNGCVKLAKDNNDLDVDAKDFLDCLACLGEDKIKELLLGGETK